MFTLETRPDNEYGYGQADPLIFVEVAGKIDPEVSVNWSLTYEMEEINGTMFPVKPKLYNNDVKELHVTINKPTSGGGVQIRFGASEWYNATDTSTHRRIGQRGNLQVPDDLEIERQSDYDIIG